MERQGRDRHDLRTTNFHHKHVMLLGTRHNTLLGTQKYRNRLYKSKGRNDTQVGRLVMREQLFGKILDIVLPITASLAELQCQAKEETSVREAGQS